MARPRSFEIHDVLQRAMNLFWERGYEGVSLADLASAMSINKPSLYAAFGDKEQLFRRAVELYDTSTGLPAQRALAESGTAREAIERVLRLNAADYAADDRPAGCMIVLAATVGQIENERVRSFLAHCRTEGEEALKRRLEQGKSDGELGADIDEKALAKFYTTVLQGMSIQARDGADRETLDKIVDAAMAAWPGAA